MYDTTLSFDADGNLVISVDEEWQKEIAADLAAYDEAVRIARDAPTPENLQTLRFIKEPLISDVLSDTLGSPVCNGWDYISPEDIGALTSNEHTMIAEDVTRNDNGELIAIHGNGGAVFHDNLYAIRNPMRDIARDGHVVFLREEIELEDDEDADELEWDAEIREADDWDGTMRMEAEAPYVDD